MNDKIRELLVESGFCFWADEEWGPGPGKVSWDCDYEKEMEKFAILIIRECISIAEGTRYDGKVVASRIKFNFGVDNEEIIRQIDDLLDAEEAAEEFENWCKESDDGAE